MRLTKRESKYRLKLIAECQYNKSEQRILDNAAAEDSRSYYDLYNDMRSGRINAYALEIAALRLSSAIRKATVTINEFTETILRFSAAEGYLSGTTGAGVFALDSSGLHPNADIGVGVRIT